MLSKRLVAIFYLLAFICIHNLVSAMNRTSENIVDENIVNIYVTANEHSYHTPWQMLGSEEYEGSGCIIADKLVLTSVI